VTTTEFRCAPRGRMGTPPHRTVSEGGARWEGLAAYYLGARARSLRELAATAKSGRKSCAGVAESLVQSQALTRVRTLAAGLHTPQGEEARIAA